MAAGADFIKTSTGKISLSATLPVGLCMAEAIRDFAEQTGRRIGLKIAGGVRTAKQGWQHLVVVQETLGPEWLDPSLFRIGASSMLDDVLFQWQFLQSGRYARPEHVGIV
jgi:deoxyribose-phosphate aldolase